jgi:hypothetical protein
MTRCVLSPVLPLFVLAGSAAAQAREGSAAPPTPLLPSFGIRFEF